jgi:23S rRNA (guanosine2251-2'-O)-methyltransferase
VYTAAWEYRDWEEIFQEARDRGEEPLFIILDSVEDPHNLGAILRTADAAGVHGVIIPKHRSVSLTSGTAKASAGAIEYVPVARVTNLSQTIAQLQEKGCWIAGADESAEKTCFATDLTGPLAIVLGGENKGLGELLKKKCDFLVRIPMQGHVNSLNVSVAASVIIYEVIRQRSIKDFARQR